MYLPVIGITMGDPTGIGPEIIVKALSMEKLFQACRPIVLGDRKVLEKTIQMLGLPATVEIIEKIPEGGYHPRKIFLSSLSKLGTPSLHFGKPDRKCGEAMVNYIVEAVKWVLSGKLDAITTCPINKQAINAAGYPFPGHTELLAHLARASVAMMFLGSKWKVVLVTTHLPLEDVSKWVTADRILSKIRMTDEGLKRYFGITNPKIAVLGLNPHCGEEGLLGEEEKKEIFPAIVEAKSQGIGVEGPFPADSFFSLLANHGAFDGVISMYHDQGLIPIKMFDLKKAINFTLGLPFIRTSVAHGTAYDIAGKGLADPTNLIQAILMASRLSKLKRKNTTRGMA